LFFGFFFFACQELWTDHLTLIWRARYRQESKQEISRQLSEINQAKRLLFTVFL
jgi:hypothetical protein